MSFNAEILALAGQVANEVAAVKRNDLTASVVKVENRFGVLFTMKKEEVKEYNVENLNQGVQITTKFTDEFGNQKVATLQIGTLVKGEVSQQGVDAVAMLKANIGKMIAAKVALGKKDTNKGVLFLVPNEPLQVLQPVSAPANSQGLGF